jgi:hypothetical protein
MSQVCREADGYQPHLVSPEFGLRRLVQDAMDLIMEPTTTAVRRVHLLLVEAARWGPRPPPSSPVNTVALEQSDPGIRHMLTTPAKA